MVNFDRHDDLGAIHSPTLVICAEDDFLTPMYFSEQLARAIPGSRLLRLPRGGHACSQSTPAEFNAALLDFLLQPAAGQSEVAVLAASR